MHLDALQGSLSVKFCLKKSAPWCTKYPRFSLLWMLHCANYSAKLNLLCAAAFQTIGLAKLQKLTFFYYIDWIYHSIRINDGNCNYPQWSDCYLFALYRKMRKITPLHYYDHSIIIHFGTGPYLLYLYGMKWCDYPVTEQYTWASISTYKTLQLMASVFELVFIQIKVWWWGNCVFAWPGLISGQLSCACPKCEIRGFALSCTEAGVN